MGTCKNCGRPLIPYGRKCVYCGAEPGKKSGIKLAEKTLCYADYVFCIDCSSSMASVVDSIKHNVYAFIKSIEDEEERIDWRVSVVGFHDTIIFETPIVFSSGFVYSSDELRCLLDHIKAEGPVDRQGSDTENEPRSVLGAIWRVAKTTEWRRKGESVFKHILVFTDAPAKPIFDDDMDEFAQELSCQHIHLEIWGKKDSFWEKMMRIPRCEIEQFINPSEFYLYKTPSDFRKSLNEYISYLIDSEE